MKKLVFSVLFLLLAATAFAHEGELNAEPGVTADSFLWGLDRALENIKLLLTFDREERIRIGLAIAEERLAEAHALKEEGKSSHDTLEQYAITLNRVKRQLEKYGADNAKEVVIEIDAEIALLDAQIAEFDSQEDVETARTELKAAVSERKSSLGIVSEDAVEKIAAMISTPTDEEILDSEAIEVIQVEDNETEVAEPVVAIDISIKAETDGNKTHVTVSGDLDKEFDLDVLTLSEVTTAIAEEMGMTEDEVSDVLTFKDANALQITVTIEDEDISRILIKQNGETKKITLAIADEAAIIREIVKRTGLTQEVVEEVIEFTTLEYTELEDPDEDDE